MNGFFLCAPLHAYEQYLGDLWWAIKAMPQWAHLYGVDVVFAVGYFGGE
jgi:hypothetical protein